MSSIALRRPRAWPEVRGALAVVAVLGLGLSTIGIGVGIAIRDGDGDGVVVRAAGTEPTVSEPTMSEPTVSIGDWLADQRDEVFPEAAGAYLGTCPSDGAGATGTAVVGLCSSLAEDLGDVQIHTVGVYATDWGADLLLESAAGSWTVTAVSPWPELGTRYDGAPWSPVTAITTWWHDRAADQYGAGTVHLHRCDDAGGIGPNDQILLCSTLVADAGSSRIYDSGRAGAPPDVRITVVEQPDLTWTVTDTRVH